MTGCTPSALGDGVAIPAACGVFVKAGATGGDGSQANPFGTLKAAVASSGWDATHPIYVCADAAASVSSTTITKSVTVFGGLACGDWTYNGMPSKLGGEGNSPTISITGATTDVTLEDLDISSEDAAADGGSSMVVFAVDATVAVTNATLTAGSGKAGKAGAPQGKETNNAVGMDGGDSGCSIPAGLSNGGAAGQQTCATFNVGGGLGGAGTTDPDNGFGGIDGKPTGMGGGAGGKGETTSGSMLGCAAGGEGMAGTHGDAAAASTEAGVLDASGFIGAPGMDGSTAGTPGAGGGGGGGANACASSKAGPGGGGGGAGGCGGNPGNGGLAGGGSFGFVSVNANATLTTVTINTAAGGAGGEGDAGQEGMDGADGGGPGSGGGACSGGKGGKGGRGGAGGGGQGGPSVGIAYVGGTPTEKGTITINVSDTPALGGNGGNGGTGNIGANGAPGLTADRHGW